MRRYVLPLIVIMITLIGVIIAGSLLLNEDATGTVTAAALRSEPTHAVPLTIYPTPIDDYLTNPGIGWQHAPGIGEQLLPETTYYINRADVSWRVLNPDEGQYDWSALDEWIERAAREQKQVSFRIYTMRGEQWGGHQVPDWVLDKGAVIIEESGAPDYSNCVYQAEWAIFVEQVRQRYDGTPEIAFIDISGYGDFNEWSWRDEQTEWDANALRPTTIDGQARQRLASMFIGGSNDDHQCRTAEGEIETVAYDYDGFSKTQLIMPYAGIRQSIQYVIHQRDDVGIRFDCLGLEGSTDGLMEKIGPQIKAVWPRAPIAFEYCAISTEPVYMEEARRLLNISHASFTHDNLVEPRDPAVIEDLLRYVGYRYLLSKAVYPSAVLPGGDLPLLMDWKNVGSAPYYPKMGQQFELHVGLVDFAGRTVFDAVIDEDISRWMPADPLPGDPPVNPVCATLTLPDYVLPGRYTLAVAIIDRRTNLPINLGFEGRNAHGYYPVGPVEISQSADLIPASPDAFEPTATLPPTPTLTPTPGPPTATPIFTPQPTASQRGRGGRGS